MTDAETAPAPKKRVALVTGGGSGIGRACVLAFAAGGMNVAVADLNADAARETCSEAAELGAQASAHRCDVADETSVRDTVAQVVSRHGRLDVLVTAAGVDLHQQLVDTAVADWTRVLGINLTGTFLFIKHAAPVMGQNGYGRIVCIGSTSGILGMGYAAYSASKAGLLGLVRSALREFSPSGITLNVVAPGPTQTPMTDALWQANPPRRGQLAAAVPVGRVASAAEIADAVAFVASERAGFINGAEIVVDGGITAVVQIK